MRGVDSSRRSVKLTLATGHTWSHTTQSKKSLLPHQWELFKVIASADQHKLQVWMTFSKLVFLNEMCEIILRFLTFTFGLSTDIEKAFLQVGLAESDRDFIRFFLRLSDSKNPESDFHVYRFKTALFG